MIFVVNTFIAFSKFTFTIGG